MVERIVDAGRAVLLERGYDGASTNRIAEKAHISPGSLYQYFPNKDAIVAEVVDRWTSELHTRISRVFTTALEGPAEELSVRGTLLELLDALGENPRLLRVLIEELPKTPDSRLSDFEKRIDALLGMWLRFHLTDRGGRRSTRSRGCSCGRRERRDIVRSRPAGHHTGAGGRRAHLDGHGVSA